MELKNRNKLVIFSLLAMSTLFSFNGISFADEKVENNVNEQKSQEIQGEINNTVKRKGLLGPILIKSNGKAVNEKLSFTLIDNVSSKKYEYSTSDGKLLNIQVEEGVSYTLKLNNNEKYKIKSINFKVRYNSEFLAVLEDGSFLREFVLETENSKPPVEIKRGWVKDKGSDVWRYYNEDGKMHRGWLYDKDVNSWYYLDENGARFSGWRFDSYYNNKYYFDKDGKMYKGWLSENGKKYYFSPSGAMQRLAWIKENNNWFYFNDSGVMYNSSWAYYKDTWYYLDKDGKMQTGWLYNRGRWYYLSDSGAMQTGWIKDGKWYYLYGNGEMAIGWVKSGGRWYYFNSSGAMQTGWLYYRREWYYLNPGGSMATGWIRDGKWYYLYSNGVWNRNAVAYSYWSVIDGQFRTDDGSRYASVGSDYIIISLSDQQLWLIRNNELVINTGIVSGKPSTPTVVGNFRVQYKERNRYLRGADYSVWVDYWMPFYWDYGIHDANWHPGYYRFENPNSYIYSGSHGCVNIYPGHMGTIFNNSYIGMPVIVIR